MHLLHSARVSLPATRGRNEQLVRLKRRVQAAFGLIVRTATFLAIAIGGGLFSSWYATSHGLAFFTERDGPWVRWTYSAQTDADPYSIVRNNRDGVLPYAATFVSRYEASTDDAGRRLHSSCHYAVQGPVPDAAWWSLSVFDDAGRLIPNPSNRFGFNAATVVTRANGSFRIDIARDARPGNWLPTPRGGRLVVVLEIQNRTGAADVPRERSAALPTISRVACR